MKRLLIVGLGMMFSAASVSAQATSATDKNPSCKMSVAEASAGSLASDKITNPVKIVRVGEVKYPTELKEKGVTGKVRLEYVVDTTGAVDPCSIHLISADNTQFVDSAVESLKWSKYSVGLLNDKPVRAKVSQVVNFTLKP